MYKYPINIFGVPPACVISTTDGSIIPFAPGNTAYEAYLKWLDGYELVGLEWVKTSEGNTPLPADEVTE
jgi:hypothetical protein